MSRIRSLHPGIFTDDRYMALSFPARELIKGVWCEADDQGLFEWKPLTLKAKLMPADAVDVASLLDELTAGEFVTKFSHAGKDYGAVRNFRRFQRPKKPNSTHFLPPELRTYVGLCGDNSEPDDDKGGPVPHQSPTAGEKPPQMKEEGDKMKEGGSKNSPPSRAHEREGSVGQGLVSLHDWQPKEQHRQQALLLAHDDAWMTERADDYRDHHVKHGILLADPDAGFRKWMRNQRRFESTGFNAQSKPRSAVGNGGAEPEDPNILWLRRQTVEREGRVLFFANTHRWHEHWGDEPKGDEVEKVLAEHPNYVHGATQ